MKSPQHFNILNKIETRPSCTHGFVCVLRAPDPEKPKARSLGVERTVEWSWQWLNDCYMMLDDAWHLMMFTYICLAIPGHSCHSDRKPSANGTASEPWWSMGHKMSVTKKSPEFGRRPSAAFFRVQSRKAQGWYGGMCFMVIASISGWFRSKEPQTTQYGTETQFVSCSSGDCKKPCFPLLFSSWLVKCCGDSQVGENFKMKGSQIKQFDLTWPEAIGWSAILSTRW